MAGKTDLSTFDNSWYSPGNPVKRLLWYYINIMFFKSRWLPISRLKGFILRLFGAKVGKGVIIKPAVNIKYPWLLRIGDHSWIGEGVWIDNLADVSIGSHVCLSQGAMLLCGNHDYSKSTFDLMVGKILLEDGVWIGAQAIVCPGVTCSSHSVLSVKSVATKNLDPYGIYQGNPATKQKDREVG
ncbi:MAG: colanic acid biosynthesis acetyltransferase WcaF [Flavobacteriales bacterium]|nr:colanic acid biosynthesis acetyltransferase WcaF [Flavobacteriales bacterium]